MWQNSETQNAPTLDSKCDRNQKLKMWQNIKCDKTQNVTTQKLKRRKNSKTPVTKLKKSKCDKTLKLKIW